MAKKIKIKLNRATIRDIAKGDEMQELIGRRVNAIANQANSLGSTDGFEARVRLGKTRVRGSVVSVSNEARRAEATDRALSKAIDAGRQ